MRCRGLWLKCASLAAITLVALSACGSFAPFSGCAQQQGQVSVPSLGTVQLGGSPGDRVAVNFVALVNQQQPGFEIALKSNPASTGYAWYITSMNDQLVKLKRERFQPPPIKGKDGKIITGVPGVQHFEFSATQTALQGPRITYVKLGLYKMGNEFEMKKPERVVVIEVKSDIEGWQKK
jgi:predicted secreted protein